MQMGVKNKISYLLRNLNSRKSTKNRQHNGQKKRIKGQTTIYNTYITFSFRHTWFTSSFCGNYDSCHLFHFGQMFRVMSSSNRRNNCKIDTSNANKCKWVWRTKYHIYFEILTVLANISTKHLNNIRSSQR
jgi:hypothetical protein